MADSTVIVLGGGLSGMAAANTVMEHGGNVILLDKSAFCGGNSTKATSGINGANTKSQKALGIEDSVELFSSDCLKGGAKKPELVKVLATNSGPDCDWLMDVFGLDLSLVARLGGHSAPRTHRGKERFPGMTITYALIQMVEKIAEKTNGSAAKVVTKARATSLIFQGGKVVGVNYEKGGSTLKEMGPVIIATGGFGADFSQDSLLAQYRPDLMHLPTSNGEHCTGDGIKMGEAVGARTIDLEWVQVHPTGLVNPKDPDAKVKFLAAEALRGVGGLIFDDDGYRFANELGRRDYVTGEMWKNKAPFRLCLNAAASEEIIWHCKHYTGRGVMKYYASGAELAKDMGVPVERMAAVTEAHYQASLKQEKDPEGGPFPAYPSGRTWDEPSGKTGSGKKFFHNVIPGSKFATEPFYVAIITPIIHYCMGGLEMTTKAEVIGQTGKPIPGLYCAGEVMGGVHGNNRLGGNSLLDCVVYGRVAGKACAEYLLGKRVKATSLKDLSGGGVVGGGTQKSALSGGSYEDAPSGGAAAPVAAASGAASGYYSMDEVAKHTTEKDCWVVVDGKVLDVTKFLPDHPGGVLAIVTFAGKDATEEFNMIHPPDVIEKYAPDAVIGQIDFNAKVAAEVEFNKAKGTYSLEEVAKHNKESDAWVAIQGDVLNVTDFLSEHPGGKLVILNLAGKDATEEFLSIHPADVYRKHAPYLIIGSTDTDRKRGPGAAGGLKAPLLDKPAEPEDEGILGGYLGSVFYALKAALEQIFLTLFTVKNFQFSNDRTGLTRSAIFLMFFMVIHAVGNLHVFLGPDDFNGYGYFYVRLYWTMGGLMKANIVEFYLLLAGLLHVSVALKRTWDINRNYTLTSGKLNLAASGSMLLIFMMFHLNQFRFGATQKYAVRPPPWYYGGINWPGLLQLRLFWSDDESIEPVLVRDIYKLEFDLFQSPIWCVFYIAATGVFMGHMIWGWAKVVPSNAFAIPKKQVNKVIWYGWIWMGLVALCYFSFPLYCFFRPMKTGALGQVG
ncbi:unnamed protein product [Amoebophrya sp. A25]|nr:unnamed protein product [Amoebophrya sp. A25]|eukprot:GSA25T00017521001.1